MKSFVRLLVLTGLLLSSSVVWPAGASAKFISQCTTTSASSNAIKRSVARSYADIANHEGYQWGGGCWNNNNKDDQPNDPTEDSSTGGEGGDCSGFTFKTWRITNKTETKFTYYDQMENVHGAYASGTWMTASTAWTVPSKGYNYTAFMDAFASTTHIAMIYTEGSSNNQDTMVEAKSEALGTIEKLETYRGNTSFKAASRNGWVPECYPNCTT